MALAVRRALSLTMALLGTALLATALLPGGAKASHISGWVDGGAAVPDDVDLSEVAAFGATGVVVAVGSDDSGHARIFRRGNAGTWVEDVISLPGAQQSDLVDVDVTQDAAWAVGTYANVGGTHPLTLRIGGGQAALAAGTPATWGRPAQTLPDGVVPTAVGLRGTDGLIGTAGGTVYPFHDASPGCTSAPPYDCIDPAVSAPSQAGAINAIALYDTGKAYTGGELQPGGGTDRIFKVDLANPATKMAPVVSGPGGPNLPIAGVGAASESDAAAVEANPAGDQDPGIWSPSANVWTRAGSDPFTEGSKPADLSLRKPSSTPVEAVAGTTQGGLGAVWWRTGTGAWTLAKPTPGGQPLNGVAVIAADDIWAVGDGGAVLHYTPLPDASISSGPHGPTTETTASFTFSSSPAGATFQCSLDSAAFSDCASPATYAGLALGQHTFRVRAIGQHGEVGPAASRLFTVVSSTESGGNEGSGGSGGGGAPAAQSKPACKKVPDPLVRGLTAKKRARMLVLVFDLAADARIKAKAYHGARLIGHTKERVLKAGHHQLKLHYRGHGKPTRLKMLARPAATNACT